MDNKSAVILHFCTFTRQGLIEQFDTLFTEHSIIGQYGQMQDYSAQASQLDDIGLFIIGLQGHDYTLGDTLRLITDELRTQYPACRVILMADAEQITTLDHYLSRLKNVVAVIDNSLPLEQLRSQLQQALRTTPTLTMTESEKLMLLAPHEHKVLSALLHDHSLQSIGRNMKVKTKIISQYKRSVLSKLGLASLETLQLKYLAGAYRAYCRCCSNPAADRA